MLHVITHTHSSEECNPEILHRFNNLKDGLAKQLDIKILGCYIQPYEHVMFFIIDADNFSSVMRFLSPLSKFGSAKVTQVLELEEAREMLYQESKV